MKVLLRNPAATARRRTRTVAAIGAAVAAGTTGLMVLAVGTAAADEPGRCNETVKVRAEPNLNAPQVGVCPAGTAVQIGEIREGYLYLTDYAGWAAWEYLTIDDPAATDPAGVAPADTDPAVGTGPADQVSTPTTGETTAAPTASSSAAATPGADLFAGDDWFDSEDGVAGADTPSTTPTADPTPGRP
jgi:hypothetical protein